MSANLIDNEALDVITLGSPGPNERRKVFWQ